MGHASHKTIQYHYWYTYINSERVIENGLLLHELLVVIFHNLALLHINHTVIIIRSQL